MGCTCTNTPNFTSFLASFTSHAPAIASCRDVPVSYNTRQASCEASIATSLDTSHSKASTSKLFKQNTEPSPSLAGDPFCITRLEFSSAVQSLKEQSLIPVRGRHFPSTCCDTPPQATQKITCPAQSHLHTNTSHCFSC